jgi:hypothetical protein
MQLFVLIAIIAAFAWMLRPRVLSANAEVVVDTTDSTLRSWLVAAGEKIYKGALVGLNPAGYLKAFVPGDLFVGIAYEAFDNSASSSVSTSRCRVQVGGDVEYTLTSAAIKDAGKPLFATADDAVALTGHPDAYVGLILYYVKANTVLFRLKAAGEVAPNGVGSIVQKVVGNEVWTTTGATAGTANIGGGFEVKSILGPGIAPVGGEDAAINLVFDATAEIALASLRAPIANLPVDKGITLDVDFVASDSGDNGAIDIDIGLGTALTTNSEADIDHADMVQLAAFHMDGASDNILAQSDNNTTDVAPVDTTIDNDSATDVPKHLKIIVRPSGVVEFWIAGARVLATTAFAVLSTAVLAPFVNMEKTSNDTTATVTVRNLRVAGGCAA